MFLCYSGHTLFFGNSRVQDPFERTPEKMPVYHEIPLEIQSIFTFENSPRASVIVMPWIT